MRDKDLRDKELLSFRPQPRIAMPAAITLEGEMLAWSFDRLLRDGVPPEETQLSMRPVAGVLRDFIALADAGPEEILAFTQARGVLGIDPAVRLTPSEYERGGRMQKIEGATTQYQEPVSVYRTLASRFGGIVRVMGALKKGGRVTDRDLLLCLQDGAGEDLWQLPRAAKHRLLWFAVSAYWDAVTIKLLPWMFDDHSQAWRLEVEADGKAPEAELQRKFEIPEAPYSYSSDVSLRFGDWMDGFRWDMERGARAFPGGLSADPEDWIDADCCPSSSSRPSPLYNALAFQLLREVTLKEGQYFCHNDECPRGLYTYDPEKARKPRKGESPKEWGNSKPRSDRPASFCSEECRRRYDTADKQRTRLEAKRKAAAQEGPAAGEPAGRPRHGLLAGTDVSGDGVNAPLGYRFVPRRPDIGAAQSLP